MIVPPCFISEHTALCSRATNVDRVTPMVPQLLRLCEFLDPVTGSCDTGHKATQRTCQVWARARLEIFKTSEHVGASEDAEPMINVTITSFDVISCHSRSKSPPADHGSLAGGSDCESSHSL